MYIHRLGSGYPMLRPVDPMPVVPLPEHVRALVTACVKGSATVGASSLTDNSYNLTNSVFEDTTSPVEVHRVRESCIELLSDACSGCSGGDRTLAEYILYALIAHVYDRRADAAAATGTALLGHFPLHITEADAALVARLSAVMAELVPRTLQVKPATHIFILVYQTCMEYKHNVVWSIMYVIGPC